MYAIARDVFDKSRKRNVTYHEMPSIAEMNFMASTNKKRGKVNVEGMYSISIEVRRLYIHFILPNRLVTCNIS